MKTKTNSAKRFYAAIRAHHVFAEDEQVFLRKDTQEAFAVDTDIAEWFSTEFRRISVGL